MFLMHNSHSQNSLACSLHDLHVVLRVRTLRWEMGVVRGLGVCVLAETRALRTSTRCKVGRPAGKELAPLQEAPEKLHVETWAGCKQGLDVKISQEVEMIPVCAVTVSYLSSLFNAPVPPGPGSVVWTMLGWTQLEKTARSGVWWFRGALKEEMFFLPFLRRETG